ncbi:MAG: Gfo/Idh/MocA family oxidoreductase [Armatimonadetes bacterium]|nr:Gfo/Idh/MocA family oxidoreductase [Armatimonadota bacterium]
MKDKVGYGIIGCGVIAPWHAGAVSRIPDAELIAVCDIVPEKAEKIKNDFGAKYVYTDYKEMLKRDDIDIVSICTPSGMHADMGIDAALAGKHVMTEKPIDISLEKIDKLIQTCAEQKVKLACIFQRRTSPLWQLVKKTIDAGKLGKLVLGDAYLKYFRSQEYYDSAGWRGTWALDGGGALMNQGVHCVDLLRWIMGPIDTIFGFADHLVRKIEVEDTSVAAIRFKNGAFGVLEGTTSVTPGMNHRLEFHGEKGTILVDGENIVRWDVPGEDKQEVTKSLQDQVGNASSDPTAISQHGHQVQIADLIAAVKEDREPMVNGAEARHAVEVILAVYQSARTGQPVKL